jgi:hypothetical protein
MVARQKKSDFQILAHFAEGSAAGVTAHSGGCAAELTSEGVGEVAMAGKSQFEGKCRQIACAVSQWFERSPQAQLSQVTMEGYSGLALKEPGQMKGRCIDRPGDIL